MESIFIFQRTLGIDKVDYIGDTAEVHFTLDADIHKVTQLTVIQYGDGKILSKDPMSQILKDQFKETLFAKAIKILEEKREITISLEDETTLVEFFFKGEYNVPFKRTFFRKKSGP